MASDEECAAGVLQSRAVAKALWRVGDLAKEDMLPAFVAKATSAEWAKAVGLHMHVVFARVSAGRKPAILTSASLPLGLQLALALNKPRKEAPLHWKVLGAVESGRPFIQTPFAPDTIAITRSNLLPQDATSRRDLVSEFL